MVIINLIYPGLLGCVVVTRHRMFCLTHFGTKYIWGQGTLSCSCGQSRNLTQLWINKTKKYLNSQYSNIYFVYFQTLQLEFTDSDIDLLTMFIFSDLLNQYMFVRLVSMCFVCFFQPELAIWVLSGGLRVNVSDPLTVLRSQHIKKATLPFQMRS